MTFCFLVGIETIYGQNIKQNNELITLNVKSLPLQQVLLMIEKQTSYRFAYSSDLIIGQKKVTINVQNITINRFLDILFKDRPIDFSIIGNQIILNGEIALRNITISGYVRDSVTGESLPEAFIYIPALKKGINANKYSFYSITVKETENLVLVASYEGYEKKMIRLSAKNSTMHNFNLVERIKLPKISSIKKDSIEENLKYKTVIDADSLFQNSDSILKKMADQLNIINDTSTETWNQSPNNKPDSSDFEFEKYGIVNNEILNGFSKNISSVSGNIDVINSIQMMPGILAGLDNTKGYYVRGGNTDQNQVLLDEASLYNPFHFFGLVSILNTSAINKSILLKEGIPASYGDKLSSTLDISMKEGNNHQIGGDLQLGTTVSGFTFYGPLKVNEASYFLSVRRSTIDLWLKPIQSDTEFNNYDFYDINAKVNYQFSQKNHIYLSFFQSKDNSSYSHDTTDKSTINYGVKFGNQAFTLRWNHLFSDQLFSNTSIVYSRYFQSINASQKPYYAQLYSGIREIDLKTDFNYFPNPNYKINFGASCLVPTLTPASVSDKELSPGSIININPADIPGKNYFRFAAYLGNEIKVGQRLQSYIGARLPVFISNDKTYYYFDPRLTIQYLLSSSLEFKVTYMQIHQYLHQVKSYNATFPAEIWIGSNNYVKPEKSNQYTAGVFLNSKNNVFHAGLNLYYKEMHNQLMFMGGIQPEITSDIESNLIFGKATAYGSEITIQKVQGKFTGLISYTLSFAKQQFDSLNLGRTFPFANDRRHCFYLTAIYNFNKHWEVSSNLIFTSGNYFTLTSVSTEFPGVGKGLYDNENANSSKKTKTMLEQNNYKLAPYNRMDISLSYKNEKRILRRNVETEWVLSVYNVYARPNTLFAYRSINPKTKDPVIRQVSFIPIIPSITYRLKF